MPDEIDDVEIPERDEEVVDEEDDNEIEETKHYPVGGDEDSSDLEAIAEDKIYDSEEKPKKVTVKKKAKAKKKAKKVVKKKPSPAARAMKVYVKKLKKKVTVKKKVVAPVKHKIKKVETKSHKRGPKGVQWKTWRIPYQESSTAGKIFLKAIEKNGITIKELTKISKQAGSNPVRNLKCLRSGKCRGWVWNVDEAHDRIRVTKYHIVDKSWKGW